jgi:hypothetical protein
MKGALLLVLAFCAPRALCAQAQHAQERRLQGGFAFPRIPEGPDLEVPDVPDPPAPAPAPTQAPTTAPTAAPVPAVVVNFSNSHIDPSTRSTFHNL